MEFLTREAVERGIKPEVPEVDAFNKAFMREVRLWGRAYELGLMAEMRLRMRNFMDDLDLGLKMFQKSKFPLLPNPTRPPRKVKPVPGAVNAVGYYPGCSLHSTASEFDVSTRAVCEALLERGVLCKETHATTLRLAPPLVITPEELDTGLDAIIDTLAR